MVNSSKKIDIFVPGRLCLFGEHSDWAGQMQKYNKSILPGRALVICTKEGIYATAKISDKIKMRTAIPSGKVLTFNAELNINELGNIARSNSFFSYVAGVSKCLLEKYDIGGIEINCYKMTLPIKKGLASSAAICTLTVRAFNQIYGLNLSIEQEMEIAYLGENETESKCGRLDQACGLGSGIVDMTFSGDKVTVSKLNSKIPLHLVFADLNGIKNTVEILKDLNAAYPYPKTVEHDRVHYLFGKLNLEIVQAAVCAIKSGNSKMLGNLMAKAQNNFDLLAQPISPKELKSEKLQSLLVDKQISKFIFGGKGVGSQGEGSVQFIAKCKNSQLKLVSYLKNHLKLECFPLSIDG